MRGGGEAGAPAEPRPGRWCSAIVLRPACRLPAAARQVEQAVLEARDMLDDLLARDDVRILGVHVEQADRVTGLSAVEAGVLDDGDAVVVVERIDDGRPDTAAGARPGD